MSSKDGSGMLNFLSLDSVDALFSDIPKNSRTDGLKIGHGVEENELLLQAAAISGKNHASECINFLGNGAYRRIIPSVVDTVVSMGEFQTSYTPYQPEISQGMLQALFEYQSVISDLTAMDVTNSSMYDGPTALGEAARMAYRCSNGNEILIPSILYRNKLSVIQNYLAGLPVRMVPYRIDPSTGQIDLQDLEAKITDHTFGIVAENPSSLGVIDPNVMKIASIKKNALLITYYDPVSLGILKPPGEYGTDIAVGEGQQLGMHLNLGGPYLGLFSFANEYLRKSPGRIMGQTTDSQGRRAFVMTLQTREQHIRRDRAMSNICSNQALMAVAALSYLATVGPSGLKSVAARTFSNSKLLVDSFERAKIGKFTMKGIPFSDVLINLQLDEKTLSTRLHKSCIAGGIAAGRILTTDAKGGYFFSVTEATTHDHIQSLVKAAGGN